MKPRAIVVALTLVAVLLVSTYAWTRRGSPNPSRQAAGHGQADGAVQFEVTGVVMAPAQGRQVSIAHDDIPGFMPAMTMPFTMGTGVDAGALRSGDRVRFALRVDQTASEAHSLVVIGRDEAVTAAGTQRPAAPASRLRRGDAVPAFTLRDQANRDVTTADLEGHLTVVTFIFTRCPLPEFCPLMVKRLQEVQAEVAKEATLGARIRLLSVTLDPAYDTPQVLHAYGTAMKADFARWRFATGTPEAIDAFAKAFAVYTERSGPSLDHTLATALIGPDGRVLEIWRGNGWKTSEVLAALRAASGT